VAAIVTANVKRNLYLEPGSRTSQLYQRALKVMPGGNTRATNFSPPYPFYIREGRGCIVVDEEGQERIDFFNNATTLILGHAYPKVVEAVTAQLHKGSVVGNPTESEVRLAEIITQRIPSVERVRFCNSGTEAVLFAVKAARAYTGRHRIAKFEGCYHGSFDEVEISLDPTLQAAGDPKAPNRAFYYPSMPPRLIDDVVVLPFNDLDTVESVLAREKDTIAAVVFDPMPGRLAYTQALPDFAPALREITRRYGMLLISDEVMSFRVRYNGTQPLYRYDADITTLGKIFGGGFPVGVVGGSAEVMSVFDPTKGRAKLQHYGTFNANPVTMVAGATTLEEMTPDKFEYINSLGEATRSRLNQLFQSRGFDAQVLGDGSLFKIAMTSKPILNYRDQLLQPERKALMQDLFDGLVTRGVMTSPVLQANVSYPMTTKEIDLLVDATEDWLNEKHF
jgi:glutamate-1-semialdehyde 2,1-aminomutase